MQNLAAWAVAGTAAYILWIKPEQKEQQKRVSNDVMQLSMPHQLLLSCLNSIKAGCLCSYMRELCTNRTMHCAAADAKIGSKHRAHVHLASNTQAFGYISAGLKVGRHWLWSSH